MAGAIHLCPCCATHLRPPQQFFAMRCNACNAELLFLCEGGVSGLVMLPPAEGVVPYSHPAQRPGHFDGRALFEARRAAVVLAAQRTRAVWCGLFFLALGMLSAIVGVGAIGAGQVFDGPTERLEGAVLAFLLAVLGLPILGYTALYFQGRARLARESVRRWL
jgi:hypothetical protein